MSSLVIPGILLAGVLAAVVTIVTIRDGIDKIIAALEGEP